MRLTTAPRLGMLTLLAFAVPSALSAADGTPAALPPMSALRIGGAAGNLLLDDQGNRFVIKGVHIYGVWFANGALSDEGAWKIAHAKRREQMTLMRSNGVNTIRLFTTEMMYDPYNQYEGIAGSIAHLVDYVRTARELGMQVLISNIGGMWLSEDAATYNARYVNFFRQLHERTRTFGNVMYEPMNEPDNISEEVWVARTKRSIDSFRSFGYDGVLWINGNHLANPGAFNPGSMAQVWAHDRNLLISLHYYKWVGWDKAEYVMKTHGGTYPFVLGEFGRENGPAGEPEAIAAAGAMTTFVSQGTAAGACAFAWNHESRTDSGQSMTRDVDNLVPNGWGQGYFDAYSKRLPDTIPGPGPALVKPPMMSAATGPVWAEDHAIRIDCGSPIDYIDLQGRRWQADAYATGGGIVDRISHQGITPISGTPEPYLYQTEHWHIQRYDIPVANGAYTIKLHFAETYLDAAGKRVFSVAVNGIALPNLDVLAEAGKANAALIKTVAATVSDGKLAVVFTPIVDQPLINAIEIIPAAP